VLTPLLFRIFCNVGNNVPYLLSMLGPYPFDLSADFGDWAGQVEGNWMGQKSGVNREGQMLRARLLPLEYVKKKLDPMPWFFYLFKSVPLIFLIFTNKPC
jgi:hypothetical protein